MSQPARIPTSHRAGVIIVYAAFLMVVVFGFAAFAIDVGYMALTVDELQNAADASALAGAMRLADGPPTVRSVARDIAGRNFSGRQSVIVTDGDIEIGFYNLASHQFKVDEVAPNAVRVVAHVENRGLFFAPVIGHKQFNSRAEAIAMINPRDIAFVVDVSGSMNDDTEPAWATTTIDSKFGPLGYPGVATNLMTSLYADFKFGAFPGALESVGLPLGVANDSYNYANMTMDNGPLTLAIVPTQYRIANTDSETVRKKKAYQWIIDNQLARLMPAALPLPQSSDTTSYDYWEKYLDYVIRSVSVGYTPPPPSSGGGGGGGGGSGGSSGGGGGGGGGPSPPPSGRVNGGSRYWSELAGLERPIQHMPRMVGQVAGGELSVISELLTPAVISATFVGPGVPRNGSTLRITLPVNQDSDRITGFNNPNSGTFPTASTSLPRQFRNQLGYLTYVQFLMDFGRDRTPTVSNSTNADQTLTKTQLSRLNNAYCPKISEATAAGTFSFPPREQPMHAARRSLIAAIKVVEDQNLNISSAWGDNVSVVSFDAIDAYHAPVLEQALTGNYRAAMTACTRLQAVSDIGNSTAIENGLVAARNHIKPASSGGSGRSFTNKVVVLLTDGVPNAWLSSTGTITSYISSNPDPDYYSSGYTWYNSVLMQSAIMKSEKIKLYPVGTGMGADYDFMDRVARVNGTDTNGQSPRGSGNPADYEQRMTQIFKEIIKRPDVRLVK